MKACLEGSAAFAVSAGYWGWQGNGRSVGEDLIGCVFVDFEINQKSV